MGSGGAGGGGGKPTGSPFFPPDPHLAPFPPPPQDGCVCPTRWVPPAGARTTAPPSAFRLTVPCPADLSWHGVTCFVLDRQTLKQKQVCVDFKGRERERER